MAYTTINDPSEYFNTVLYTGNGRDDRPVIGTGFQPDWLWIKERSSTSSHRVFDSSRGASKRLDSNTQSAEGTDTTQQKSFDSDGFTVGTSGSTNATGDTYVAWQWKANAGTTASNTDGNLTTTVQANQTAGFSIVLWTSTGSSDNIGHGLGATPKVIIEKSRSAGSTDWTFYTNAGGNKLLFLNNSNAVTTSFSGVANVGSSLFTDGNSGTDTRVAWCFAEKQGYSKFGLYTGNGNADGPFIYLGFKPAWVLFKNLTAGHDWRILDNKRNTSNSNNTDLRPNTNDADSSGSDMDFLSNGIKMRDTDGDLNEDGASHFYMAFAESPCVTSNGIPNNAR
jgi:hypothetical protein